MFGDFVSIYFDMHIFGPKGEVKINSIRAEKRPEKNRSWCKTSKSYRTS